MAYEGELLRYCPGRMFDFKRAYAVIVSGDDFIPHVDLTRNRKGHMLLNTGGPGGYYFQTAGGYTAPRMMSEAQFQRYLQEHGKFIITVIRIYIPRPEKSQMRLEQLLAGKWLWGGIIHNCESLVEEIVTAGGGPRLHTGWLSLPTDSTNQCTAW
jgi:hypothetical protein